MSKMEFEKLEKELHKMTLAKMKALDALFALLSEVTDEELELLLAKMIAAEYVMREVRGSLRGEILELHDWIHQARQLYSERLKHVHRRAAVRAGSGRSEELVTDRA